ncbi:hypothetical protein NQZ79_g7863 [Umbelopsis isabellina]|nr:hypothetical protein NQZ79_g7863 [Umbelopsis isabellina]
MKTLSIVFVLLLALSSINAAGLEKRQSCKTDDDCPGVTCCNLNTLQCVSDPNGTICDIPPTKTKTTSTSKKTTTTKKTTTSTKKATTSTKKTTTTKKTTSTKTTSTATATGTGKSGKTVALSSSKLCFFLPPTQGEEIADSEKTAIAFCQSSSDAPGAHAFPSGFITSSHYKSGHGAGDYVQYTGLIDISKYKLKSSDEGGQYDNHGSGSPPGSSCEGYKYYVNLVEPAERDYCIRCCQDASDCPTGRSEAGCQSIIPGTYSAIISAAATGPNKTHTDAVSSIVWTAPTREQVESNPTLKSALSGSTVFPLGVGLDQPASSFSS